MSRNTRDEGIAMIEAGLLLLCDDHPTPVSPTHELEQLASLRRIIERLKTRHAVLLADADTRSVAEKAQGTNLRTWLGGTGHLTKSEAAALVFGGHDLLAHQGVREAALAGQVSEKQASSISSVLLELPKTLSVEQQEQASDYLVGQAATLTSTQLRSLTTKVLDQIDPLTPAETQERLDKRLRQQRDRAIRNRHLRFQHEDGSVRFSGSLPTIEGESLIKLVDAYRADNRRRARETRHHPAGPGRPETTPDQQAADALLQIIQAVQHGRGAPTLAGDRPRVVVIMHEHELQARAEQTGMLASGELIPAGDLRRLCCDADLLPVVLGADSEILDLGRTRRLVDGPVRAALSLRDQGCTFPGCHEPDSNCEAHHIIPWWAGGATALSNLVLLCPTHHRQIEPLRQHDPPGQPDTGENSAQPRLTAVPRGGRPWAGEGSRWEVRINQHHQPEFLPPTRVDPSRTPIPAEIHHPLIT